MTQAKRVHSTPRRTASKTKRKLSAVSNVKKSGLDLVPTRKSRGKPATMRDYAKIDFKPWKRDPGMKDGEMFPSHDVIAEHGVTCRIAYGLMLMTRHKMIDMHSRIDHDKIDEVMANLVATGEFMKATAQMVESAYQRVLASAAAAHTKGIKFKGADYESGRGKAV